MTDLFLTLFSLISIPLILFFALSFFSSFIGRKEMERKEGEK